MILEVAPGWQGLGKHGRGAVQKGRVFPEEKGLPTYAILSRNIVLSQFTHFLRACFRRAFREPAFVSFQRGFGELAFVKRKFFKYALSPKGLGVSVALSITMLLGTKLETQTIIVTIFTVVIITFAITMPPPT